MQKQKYSHWCVGKKRKNIARAWSQRGVSGF